MGHRRMSNTGHRCCIGLEHWDEAEFCYKEVLSWREKNLPADHTDIAAALNNLATLYNSQKRYAEEEQAASASAGDLTKAYGPAHPSVARQPSTISASATAPTGRFSEAGDCAERALKIMERGAYDPACLQRCYRLRAQVAWHADHRAEAIADLGQALP